MFTHKTFELQDLQTKNIDGKRFYVTPDDEYYPSITTVLSARKSKGLKEWRARVGESTANYIARTAAIRGTQVHSICEDFLNNKLFQTLYDSIKWNKFVQPKEKGLWEHMLTNKTLVEVQSTVDYHPSTLCHLSYFKKYIKPILESKTECRNNIDILENKALQFSKYYKQHCENLSELPEFDQGLKQEFFKKYNEY